MTDGTCQLGAEGCRGGEKLCGSGGGGRGKQEAGLSLKLRPVSRLVDWS